MNDKMNDKEKKEPYIEEMYDAQGNQMGRLDIFMTCIGEILQALKITNEDIKKYGGAPDRPPHLLAIDFIKKQDDEIKRLQEKLNMINNLSEK